MFFSSGKKKTEKGTLKLHHSIIREFLVEGGEKRIGLISEYFAGLSLPKKVGKMIIN